MKNEKPNKKKSQGKPEAREPETVYNGEKIVFFNSLEEMNEYDHRYYASLTPEKRLQIVLEIRNTIWPDNHAPHPFGSRINFER